MKIVRVVILALICSCQVAPWVHSQSKADKWLQYVDPEGRFTFSYPSEFGTPSPGTNNGYGQTAASIRFSAFSSGAFPEGLALGGEATLTRGFVFIDLQAMGGLYDSLTLEAFPEPLRSRIISSLVPLSASNFCSELAKIQHLDPGAGIFAALTAQQKEALARADRIRNVNPRVDRCDVLGNLVVFCKETGFDAKSPGERQYVYGAIRFLPSPYASFQVVRATKGAPAPDLLDRMTNLIQSLVILKPR